MSSSALAEWIGTYAMTAAGLVAYAFALDPRGYEWGAGAIAPIKYLPAELAVVALFAFALDRGVGRRRPIGLGMLAALAALVLAGASYTVLVRHNRLEDSFLGRGLNLLTVFPAFALARRPRAWQLFWRWMRGPTFATGALMLGALLVWSLGLRFVGVPNIYHEEIFIPTCGAVAAFVAIRDGGMRLLVVVGLLSAGLLTIKFTGFLAVALGTVLVIACTWRSTGDTDEGIIVRRVLLLGSIGVAIIGAGGIFLLAPQLLPSGSPAVRVVTYGLRLAALKSHPILGQVFTGSPMIVLPRAGFQAPLDLPSHSDLLDLLAFGGIVGATLLGIPVLRSLWRMLRGFRDAAMHCDWVAVYLTAVLLVMTMEVTFNPIWNQPALMFFFWLALGYGLATEVGGGASQPGPREGQDTAASLGGVAS